MTRICGIALQATLLCALASATPPQTSFEAGWFTLESDGLPLLHAGAGLAAQVVVDDRPFPESQGGAAPTADGAEIRYVSERGTLTDTLESFPLLEPAAWLRSLRYTNTSDTSQDLTAAKLWIQPVCATGGAKWTPVPFFMAEAASGKAVCLSYRGSTDYYRIEEGPDGRIGHHVDAA